MKIYRKLPNGTELKICVDYNKGGAGTFVDKIARGYYLSIYPVTREFLDNGLVIEKATAMSGLKKLLFRVERQSAKAYVAAVEDALKQIDEIIDNHFNS